MKSVFKQLSQAWQGLTNAQILAWNSAAGSAEAKSVLGSKTKISGSNLFMRLNYWVVYCGGNILTTPPVLGGVDAPSEAVITLTDEKFTFELENAPVGADNLRLVIQASEPQSNGITRAYAKAAAFADPYAVGTDEINLKADYDAKCGAPSAGTPKVFMKYFFVNTQTGEKSGEMLAAVKLQKMHAPASPGDSVPGDAAGDDSGQGSEPEQPEETPLARRVDSVVFGTPGDLKTLEVTDYCYATHLTPKEKFVVILNGAGLDDIPYIHLDYLKNGQMSEITIRRSDESTSNRAVFESSG